ncbi:hypothetical protein F4604DRAFT_1692200 [Suillus subluteus]|nr:hypothetical protein F4604DRAFT_1692200 [Suillus subluteus]
MHHANRRTQTKDAIEKEQTKSADSVKGGVQAVKKGKGGRKDEPWEVELRVDKCVSFVYVSVSVPMPFAGTQLIQNHSHYLFRCRLLVHNIPPLSSLTTTAAIGSHTSRHMAHTKDTAKKATGGLVARVNLDLDGAGNVSVVMELGLAVCEGFKHNEFCIICRDSSVEDDYLLLCDKCPCVVCTDCVKVPPAFTQAIMSPHDNTNMTVACQYIINQKPLLDTFLPVRATLELSVRIMRPREGPSNWPIMFEALFSQRWLSVPGVSKVKTYQASVNNLVHTLSTNNWKRIVFGISNHTDNTHGDPFVGYDKNKYVATWVDNFLDIILAPWQVLIDNAAESFLWFFSCGALVNNAKSFYKLHVSVACDLVLIQCLSMRDAFPDKLGQSYMLGRHSDVFLLVKSSNSLGVFKYSWTHSQLRPWGDFLPLQCSECGLVDAWSSANHAKIYVFECKGVGCRKSFTFSPPTHSRVLTPGKTCITYWIEIPV